MKVLVQNLQKRNGLATQLFEEHHHPDVMLVQEINIYSETCNFTASNVSKRGYGTAIGSEFEMSNIKYVESPYAEVGGFIRKKTTIATIQSVQFVTFHGYNGQPFKDKDKLVAHVEAVLEKLTPGPALLAGDFNTWSKEHLDVVKDKMEGAGFHLAYSWPYGGRDFPLDHAFIRGLEMKQSANYECASDHRGAILEFDDIVEASS